MGLLKGELDLGLTLIHRKVTGLHTTTLYQEQVRAYVATAHKALWQRPTLSLSDIASLRLTTYTHREPSPLTDSVNSGQFYFCPQIEGVLILILTGNHVGMLPKFYAQSWLESGQIKELPVAELSLDSPIVAMSKSGGPKQDLVDQLVEIMAG